MGMIDALKEKLRLEGEITFRVKVRPQARVSRFRGPLGEDTFKVDIAAPPEDGKANDALVRFLAEKFEVSRSRVEILTGQTGRLKMVRLRSE